MLVDLIHVICAHICSILTKGVFIWVILSNLLSF